MIDNILKEFDEMYPNDKNIKCFLWRVLTEQKREYEIKLNKLQS